MGGYGSGQRWSKATTVEECSTLDANRWMREGILRDDEIHSGLWQWTYSSGRRNSISYYVNTLDGNRWVKLTYTVTVRGEKQECDYKVRLTTTTPYLGGLRWWFRCPAAGCGRRVATLHLPPGALYFACRTCYRLTYRSCQESDKRIGRLLRDPDRLLAMAEHVDSTTPQELFLLIKAYQRMGAW